MSECSFLCVFTSGHVTKMAATSFDLPYSRKPHAARKLRGYTFYRTGVTADRSFTLREYEFLAFLTLHSCDLDLDPVTFIYELDPYSLEICAKMNFLRPLFRKLTSDMQTYRQTGPTLYTPLRGCSKNLPLLSI